ncbi:MAG: DUF3155 domain-containing protein [Richelia sp. RM1_1_1]|nr:DUF3155 domain-containing protein [Richelia sp. RM1_1_1]
MYHCKNFIHQHQYQSPCVVTVYRHDGKNEKFFYSCTGLFDYNYALVNYQQFQKEINQSSVNKIKRIS